MPTTFGGEPRIMPNPKSY
ncbi:hypothetical protein [Staphylococcus aureus]